VVDQARQFLSGRSQEIQQGLSSEMSAAAETLDYEGAAVLRDRIRALTQIQSRQDINVQGLGEADVLAVHLDGGQCCIQVFFFRAGQNLGNRSYFPSQTANLTAPDILEAFMGQFYANHPPPKLVLTSQDLPNGALMAEALSMRAGRRVALGTPNRGSKRKLIDHALANAAQALARRMAESATQRKLLEGVGDVFGLDGTPERIEVYDNSHISGAHAIGAMIVAGPDGLMKNAWRKFNIRTVAPTGHTENSQGGDDYAMMREVLTRRFARALKEDPERSKGQWPDLVLIDGGAGQLKIACEVFADLGVTDVGLAGVAKGPDRNAGRERFFMPGREPFSLEPNDPVLYFLQRLRDEAHRFAIGGHRAKRSAAIGRSQLDEVAGIGATRKRALLHHFGSARAVAEAGLGDLEAVRGISRTVAKKIYDHFHGGT
jgi:excinuclease ABC subunit C